MKGGTPSCVSVTIPQAHLHLALMYEERDDIKTIDNIPPPPGLETAPISTRSHFRSVLYRKHCASLIIF